VSSPSAVFFNKGFKTYSVKFDSNILKADKSKYITFPKRKSRGFTKKIIFLGLPKPGPGL
jgi:hypothetical protein